MGTLFKRKGRPNWYAQYVDGDGKRVAHRSTGTSDKAAAKRILAKWEADAALRREGVIDLAAERLNSQVIRPFREHLKDFRASLSSAGKTQKHITATVDVIESVQGEAGWQTLGDIAIEHVEAYGARLRTDGAAGRTIQRKLAAMKQFTRWCHTTGRLASNPLIALKTPSPKTDRKLERRALHPDEWPLLRAATEASPPKPCGITGPERAMLYELAIQTGLRSNELRNLTAGKLHLDADPPFVIVGAGTAKNRKQARQYITKSLRERLASHVKSLEPGAPLFRLPHETDMAEMLRDDLAKARKAWVEAPKSKKEQQRRAKSDFLSPTNHEGQALDFHALRHTCGAWLAVAGENPKTIQVIMRHSSITLTMDTYGHLFPASESDAIARLGKRHFG